MLGELKLYTALDSLRQYFVPQLLYKLLLNFIKTFIVAGVALYLVHKMATAHLLRIARHAQSIQPDKEYKPLALNRKSPVLDDELSLLISAINTMGERQQVALLSSEQQNKALEKLVDERTEHLALANQKLLDESQLATIGSLVAMVAHELRNPLGTIKATAALLHAHSDKEFERNALKRIDRNVERCDSTVEQLRRAGSRSTHHWLHLDFGAWVECYVETQLELEPSTILEDDLPSGIDIFVDQFQLDLVVRNLFENAQQALKELPEAAQKRISVKLSKGDKDATLTITDTGVGLSAEVLGSAFNPLFTTKQYGFGMGLSLSRYLIRSLGGSLDIYSAGKMQGATVELVLPLAHQVSPQNEAL